MNSESMIPVNDFCTHYNVELSFIYSLKESGLIEITSIDENVFVHVNQLKQLEQLLRFNQEMGINIEGIETICHLLLRIREMQEQIVHLNNQLAFYQND